MKTFIFALSLFITGFASAASVKVLDIPVTGASDARGEFGFNEQLGRVWVEIEVTDWVGTPENTMPDYYRTRVAGLEYDPTTKSAVLTIEGQNFECAVLRQRGILVFRTNYMKATGCNFTSKVVTELYDNGFEIEERRKLQVFLVTK